ncbi:MAG TPA: hypothetical protein VMT81_02555 [Candidatus Paceibacterota bacterium]|nr:hypothetical protein [Candidatus Paceibacterota bacterium]
MKYDLYFHNDFDGRAAAAVVLAFLRSRGDDAGHYVPLKYDIMPEWMDEDFFSKHRLFSGKRHPAVVVDFPYHPQAAFWFDHHLKPFRKPGWEKRFRTDRAHRYDDTYPSACHLAYDWLERSFGWKPPAHLRELAEWLDVIDGANYRSAKQTIEMKEPAIRINNFIENKTGDVKLAAWTVQHLAQQPLGELVKDAKVRRSLAQLKRGTGKALSFYEKNIKIDGRVMVTDLTGFKYGDLAHYGPYYLHPKLLYQVRFHPFPGKPALFHINVSANPWLRKRNKKNIGQMLKGYGGGGHHDVGGTEIEGKTKTLGAVAEMVKFLNAK